MGKVTAIPEGTELEGRRLRVVPRQVPEITPESLKLSSRVKLDDIGRELKAWRTARGGTASVASTGGIEPCELIRMELGMASLKAYRTFFDNLLNEVSGAGQLHIDDYDFLVQMKTRLDEVEAHQQQRVFARVQ